jgi:magnesium transporter
MAFISELIGKNVTDIDGKKIGNLLDVIAKQPHESHHPIIQALVIKYKRHEILISFSDVAVLISTSIAIKLRIEELTPYTNEENDFFLKRDVLDKQIIDTNGARVVRVNDLELIRISGSFYVSNVDIGSLGILRRIGLGKPVESIFTSMKHEIPRNFISWDYVELLHNDQFMRLKVPGEKISELHPADIAEIISDMNYSQGGRLLEQLDIEHLADALEEVEPEFQASLVQNMSDEKVADVLEEMSPDEAADLLAELPRERSEDLLELMQDEEADDVRLLLSYPEDSAGGLMTTDIATVRPGLTAKGAIDVIRSTYSEAESIFYVYVTDEQEHLIGVFSLSDLVLAQPNTPVTSFMHHKVVSANVLDKQDKLAQMISKYNLLTIPIVDDDNKMLGMVTADDALDKIIPTAWKKRLPRFYFGAP